MAPPPSKRGKPNIDIHTLSSSDRQALERTAALLNKSVSQLLEAPVEQGPHPYTAGGTPPVPIPRPSHGSLDTGPSLANPQFWATASRYMHPDEPQVVSPLSSPARPSQGSRSTISELETLSLELWQDPGVSLNRGTGNSFLPPGQLASGTSSFQQLTMGECQIVDTVPTNRIQLEHLSGPYLGDSTEANELFDSSPDTSSEGSENENNLLDAQAWENLPFAPVDQFATSAGSNGSDYIWIEECEESQETQPKAQVDALNAVASQWIRGDNNPKARQKSRGPFQDQHLRTETSNTRKLKACVRCRMQKVRVRVPHSLRIYNRADCRSVELI